MENTMEATIIIGLDWRGYTWIVEKKMETTIVDQRMT